MQGKEPLSERVEAVQKEALAMLAKMLVTLRVRAGFCSLQLSSGQCSNALDSHLLSSLSYLL